MLVVSSRSPSLDMWRSYPGGSATSTPPLPAEAPTVLLSLAPLSIEHLGDAAGVSPNGVWLLTPGRDVARPGPPLDTEERGPMQVQCSKCLQLIALSDIVD